MSCVAPPPRYRKIFAALDGVRGGQSGNWSSRCPAHNDEHQSLSLAVGSGGCLMLRCHSPCSCRPADILSAIGFTFADVCPERYWPTGEDQSMSNMKFVKSYDYRDEQNNLLFQVLRWEPKAFSQRRPNPDYDPKQQRDKEKNPEFLTDVRNVRRVLYKLPDLLKALREVQGRWLFVLEGEKDVDLAWRNGVISTTNPMGAGKWDAAYSASLKGLKVAVIPDEDPTDTKTGVRAGLKHAAEVCNSLVGVAAEVKMIRLGLPPDSKQDFTDWWLGFPKEATSDDHKRALGQLLKATGAWVPTDPTSFAGGVASAPGMFPAAPGPEQPEPPPAAASPPPQQHQPAARVPQAVPPVELGSCNAPPASGSLDGLPPVPAAVHNFIVRSLAETALLEQGVGRRPATLMEWWGYVAMTQHSLACRVADVQSDPKLVYREAAHLVAAILYGSDLLDRRAAKADK